MRSAPRAIPENGAGGTAASPLPAAMPATWVPWKHTSNVHGAAAPGPTCVSVPSGQSPTPSATPSWLAKQASASTLPARNGCPPSTPVSRMAMTVPLPSIPAAHACGA